MQPQEPPTEAASAVEAPSTPSEELGADAITPPVKEPRKKPVAPPKEPAKLGRGGSQHKYLQHLVKNIAEERGFRATIEEPILDGAGSVDVSLMRGDVRIACEISVTTNRDQELGNIEKCLDAGYTRLVLIGRNDRHAKTLEKFIEENLDEGHQGKVHYTTPEQFLDYINSLTAPPPTEQTVRGYKVRTIQKVLDPKEADTRRKAVAEVITRSLKRRQE